MISKLKDFFEGKTTLRFQESGHITGDDLKIATAALLLEVAGADNNYDPHETKMVFDLLVTEFALEASDSYEFLEVANILRKDRKKIKGFIELLCEHFDEGQRERVLSLSWKIAMADSAIHAFESDFCARLGAKLDLTAEQINRARLTAEEESFE